MDDCLLKLECRQNALLYARIYSKKMKSSWNMTFSQKYIWIKREQYLPQNSSVRVYKLRIIIFSYIILLWLNKTPTGIWKPLRKKSKHLVLLQKRRWRHLSLPTKALTLQEIWVRMLNLDRDRPSQRMSKIKSLMKMTGISQVRKPSRVWKRRQLLMETS